MAEMEKDNLEKTRRIYEHLKRTEFDYIVQLMAPDVEWVVHGPSDVPWFGTWHTRNDAGEYFTKLMENLDQTLEPVEFIAQGEDVVVRLRTSGVLVHNGRRIEGGVVHIYTYRDGQIQRFESYQDTATVVDAWRAAA